MQYAAASETKRDSMMERERGAVNVEWSALRLWVASPGV